MIINLINLIKTQLGGEEIQFGNMYSDSCHGLDWEWMDHGV